MKLKKRAVSVQHPDTAGKFVKSFVVGVTPPWPSPNSEWSKEQFNLIFESEVKDASGRHYSIKSRPYPCEGGYSLGPRSALGKDVRTLLGRDLTTEEMVSDDIDVEKLLLGCPVEIVVGTKISSRNGLPYAEVKDFRRDQSDSPMKPSGQFIPAEENEGGNGGNGPAVTEKPAAVTDEMPF